MQLNISENIEDLSWRVAEWMVSYITETLDEQDRFTIALSGGSTPKKLNELLASDEFRNRIDWSRLHIFWGDERYVPFTDERNNAHMAFTSLLDHVHIPASQIHIMRTDIDPDISAAEYEHILSEYFPLAYGKQEVKPAAENAASGYTFDLVLLGLGDNMHTLSLFPHEEIIHEKNKWVAAVFVKEISMQRITLTAPVVNKAKRIAFLVSGEDKAAAVAHVLTKDYAPDQYPAQIIQPANGALYWFLDKAAAGGLSK